MAGIYIHIPFCKQACHYCNFHFATSLLYKNEMVNALLKEISMRSEYLAGETVETIYFGGGTPSLLSVAELERVFLQLKEINEVTPGAEVTLEANPDDITIEKLEGWQQIGINRLSIGVQSFFDDDLAWMNRAHNAEQAKLNLALALKYFNNITIDLIYGTPHLTNEHWKFNVDFAVSLGIPHLSCYALTVEPKTPLHKMIGKNLSADVDPGKQSEQFLLLMDWMEKADYEHYEISNFAKPGWRSRHNSSYWKGKAYLGIGPSAHSFNQDSRQWNISNNNSYIAAIEQGSIPFTIENLTAVNKLNEYIMTALRTSEGLDLDRFDENTAAKIISNSQGYLDRGLIKKTGNKLVLGKEGKLYADGIAAELFF